MRLLDIIESNVTERYSRDNLALLRYMKNAEIDVYEFWSQYAEDWIYHDSDVEEEFEEWAAQAHPDEDISNLVQDYEPPHDLPENLLKSFQDYVREYAIQDVLQNDPAQAPTWAHMDLNQNKLLKRQTWLLHFSDNADDIARDGFTVGMDQMDRLGLTTYFNNEGNDKSYGGYNFAFKANDPRGYLGGEKYGSHLVMFQNSGVEAWHHGDEENQVMFKGEDVDPRGIILIENDYGDWVVRPHPLSRYQSPRDEEELVRFDNLEKVVKWVIQNVDQYRKAITGY